MKLNEISDFIKLHDIDTRKEFAIRISNIAAIYDIDSKNGTQIEYHSSDVMAKIYTVENTSEILQLIGFIEGKEKVDTDEYINYDPTWNRME